jgi:hypothetical protein
MRDYESFRESCQREMARMRQQFVQMRQNFQAQVKHVKQQAHAQMRQIVAEAKKRATPVSEIDQILQAFLAQHHYDFVEFWHPDNKSRVVKYLTHWIAEIKHEDDLKLTVISETDKTQVYKINLYDPESFDHLLDALGKIWRSMPESKRYVRNTFSFVARVLYERHFIGLPLFLWAFAVAVGFAAIVALLARIFN